MVWPRPSNIIGGILLFIMSFCYSWTCLPLKMWALCVEEEWPGDRGSLTIESLLCSIWCPSWSAATVASKLFYISYLFMIKLNELEIESSDLLEHKHISAFLPISSTTATSECTKCIIWASTIHLWISFLSYNWDLKLCKFKSMQSCQGLAIEMSLHICT